MSEATPDEADDEPLVVRLGDGPALVLVRMQVADHQGVLIDQAALRPNLIQTTIARTHADALGLSPGQAAMLQLAREADGDPWGPCEMVTPAVVDDPVTADAGERSASLLLGRDFLHSVWVTFVGSLMVMITRPDRLEG